MSLFYLCDRFLLFPEFSKELPEEMRCERYIQFEKILAISAEDKTGVKIVKDYVRSALEKNFSDDLKLDDNRLKASQAGFNRTGSVLI